jgi:hypothetical protein
LGSSGIAARLTTNAASDARHATVDRASVPAFWVSMAWVVISGKIGV